MTAWILSTCAIAAAFTLLRSISKRCRKRTSFIALKPRTTALTLAAVVLIAALTVGCAFGGAGETGGTDPVPEDAIPPVESASPQPSEADAPRAPDEAPTAPPADLAAHYFDLFRADDGLIILLGLAEPGVGGFSDDQLSAYALHTLAYQGGYDYETGLSREDMNAVTQKHFGRDIQNFENSMTTVLDSGRVTATGWSFDAGVHLVLDGEPEERDGATAARFKCYELSDGLWFSDEMDQEKLEHAREYLLSGDDGEFPAPRLVEIVFEERYDEQTQSPYVLYRSLTIL